MGSSNRFTEDEITYISEHFAEQTYDELAANPMPTPAISTTAMTAIAVATERFFKSSTSWSR